MRTKQQDKPGVVFFSPVSVDTQRRILDMREAGVSVTEAARAFKLHSNAIKIIYERRIVMPMEIRNGQTVRCEVCRAKITAIPCMKCELENYLKD